MEIRDTVLTDMKNNILLKDYLSYIGNKTLLFDFKYFSPLYSLSQPKYHKYLSLFSIPYSEDLDYLLQRLLINETIVPDNLTKVSNKFFLKMIAFKINLFLQLDEQTIELSKIAILDDCSMLKFVVEQTDELINYAIANITKIPDKFLTFIDVQSDEICLNAIKKNFLCFKYVKNKSNEMCLKAFEINTWCIMYCDIQKNESCDYLFNANPKTFRFLKNKSENICLKAVENNLLNISFIKNEEILNTVAVKQNNKIDKIKKLVYNNKETMIVYLKDCFFDGMIDDDLIVIGVRDLNLTRCEHCEIRYTLEYKKIYDDDENKIIVDNCIFKSLNSDGLLHNCLRSNICSKRTIFIFPKKFDNGFIQQAFDNFEI